MFREDARSRARASEEVGAEMFTVNRGGHGVAFNDRARFDAPALAVSTAIVRTSGPAPADLGAVANDAVATSATYVAWRLSQRTLVKRHAGITPAHGTAPGWFAQVHRT